MATSRNKVIPPVPSDGTGVPASKAQGGTPKRAGSTTPTIRVRCPNPSCATVHTLKASWAGKTGQCPTCGIPMAVPPAAAAPKAASARPTRPQIPAPVSVQTPPREELPGPVTTGLAEVRAGCIGRGNAGKTALFRALLEGAVGDFLPSGLHVDAGDPRDVARMIYETEETRRLLETSGLPATREAAEICYYLYDGAEQRAVYHMHEVIGQVLTHTLPDSAAEQQARFAEYLRTLVNAQVLWAVVPCPPPSPGPRDRRRYANDLRITLAYLREALRLRSLEQPASVALVLSKIDTLFDDAEAARAALPDDVLRSALGPLVTLLKQSARVSAAAIIPVTAFGFGNAVLHDQSGARGGTPQTAPDDPFGEEPTWLLREGTSAAPFNLDTLFLWTLLRGLRCDAAEEGGTAADVAQVCRLLHQDLHAGDPWLVTLRGDSE